MQSFIPLRRQLVCLVGTLAIVTIGPGGELKAQDVSLDPLVAAVPFVNENTFLLARIEPAAFEDLRAQTQAADVATEPVLGLLDVLRPVWKPLESFAAGQTVYVSAGIPSASGQTPLFVFRRGGLESASDLVLTDVGMGQLKPYTVDDYAVFSPQVNAIPGGRPLPEEARRRFAAGFASVQSSPVQVVVLAPQHVRRTFRELGGELPSAWGGGLSGLLAEEVQWMALGVDIKRRVAEVVVQAEQEAAAKRLAAKLPERLRTAHAKGASRPGSLASSVPTSVFESLIEWLQPQRHGDQLRSRLDLIGADGPATLLRKLVQYEKQQDERRAGSESIRRILLALHNYHATYNRLPPRIDGRDDQGQTLLSWRVHLLPFLGHDELYRRFRLDQPWDSDHNQALLTEMPEVFRPWPEIWNAADRDARQPGHTAYLALQGPGTALGRDQPTAFRDIIDGLSNTAVIVEAARDKMVPWTSPQDYVVDDQRPLAGLHLDAQGRWVCGLGDGRVVSLPGDMPAGDVKALFHIADRETLNLQQYLDEAAPR